MMHDTPRQHPIILSGKQHLPEITISCFWIIWAFWVISLNSWLYEVQWKFFEVGLLSSALCLLLLATPQQCLHNRCCCVLDSSCTPYADEKKATKSKCKGTEEWQMFLTHHDLLWCLITMPGPRIVNVFWLHTALHRPIGIWLEAVQSSTVRNFV